MSIIWIKSTKSGLCDRLIDLLLMATLAKMKGKDLTLKWEIQPSGTSPDLEKLRPNYRWFDYKLENLNKYIQLPNHVKIYDCVIKKNDNDEIFNSYLGSVFSPMTFHQEFAGSLCNYKEFEKVMFKIAGE